MICRCGTKLIWGGDNPYHEVGREGEGLAQNFTCPKCKSFVVVYWDG